MLFDDRLATVLRKRAASDAGLRTQFRQLLDLLGTSKDLDKSALKGDAFERLGELMEAIPGEEQSRILREPGQRLRNPEFVAFLASGEPKPAAAAMATARLTDDQWLDLIPRLPVTARGFLRHRRDLPPRAKRMLERLGVGDLVLPAGAGALPVAQPAESTEKPATPVPATPSRESGIGELRRRIAAFQEGRRLPGGEPRLPLGDTVQHRESPAETLIDATTDAEGVVVRAEGSAAPALVGMKLTSPNPGTLVDFDAAVAARLRRRQPLHNAAIAIAAAPQISGPWQMDAVPLFASAGGAFSGYALRLYRPVEVETEQADSPGDAMRQVLHELRTPVNAIQGFAEIIQQQLFGNVPHEYRAHAAAIAVDSAKLLAGFDEVDRLVKLEGDALEMELGSCDFRAALVETIRRLEGVLRPRNAGFVLEVSGSPFGIGVARDEAMVLCWRLLASAANALGPNEQARLDLSSDGDEIHLQLDIPESLRNAAPAGPAESQRPRAISAGMFGPRFAFRLAEAEAAAMGGELTCAGDRASLRLPALTSEGETHSTDSEAGSG